MAEFPFNVIVNWTVLNDRFVKDAVVCKKESCDSEDEIEETVSLESCIRLKNEKNGDTKCMLTLCDFQSDVAVSQMIVVSEARKIELYSDKKEYLLTVNSEFVAEIEDFYIYKANISFPSPLKSCSLKFLCLRIPTEVWLYGIRVTLKIVPTQPPINSNLDLNKVLNRIHECDEKMSDRAKSFAKFLSMYKKPDDSTDTSAINAPSNFNKDQMMMMLLKHLQLSKKKHINDRDDGDKYFQKQDVNIQSTNKQKECSTDGITESTDFSSLLSTIIKKELQYTEERLWSRIETHLQQLEARQLQRMDEMYNMLKGIHQPTLHDTTPISKQQIEDIGAVSKGTNFILPRTSCEIQEESIRMDEEKENLDDN